MGVRATALGGSDFRFYIGNTAGDGYGIYSDGTNVQGLAGGIATFCAAGAPGVLSNSWILSRKAGTWQMYKNGVAAGSTGSTTPAAPSALTSFLGATGSIGIAADIFFYNVPLSPAEIYLIGGRNLDPRFVRPQALVEYWPLDQDTKGAVYGITLTQSASGASNIFLASSNAVIQMVEQDYPLAWSSGISFGAAANSGDIAAASSYSGSASWSGSDRYLAVDVSMLGPGVTVTAMTYGGATCTKIGSQSTVTSFGSVECWGIKQSDSGAPAAGSNTLAVTLSSSIEFTVEWASYTGVHQTSPTEAFNSAQATNVGAADATVNVTTVADNDWVHAAIVTNDTSITSV